MAQNGNIIDGWTMREFFMENSQGENIKRVPCINSQTGEHFCMLAFGRKGSQKFVNFGKKLGELSDSEINARKDNLQVVETRLTAEQKADRKARGLQERQFILCNQGANVWQEVHLDW